ncbi:Dynein regulatory complex protein 9 [Geodia barretti]|uniref:Dynein regulatory complex protein 9 n=1 Tax=Geodia barretti TaxID=519541 RepID=A0AA35TLM8_GEOBA|nr:Dynein regulatory complex protein 9 [Geodia barretti]
MATKVQSSLRLAGQGSSGPVVLSPVERELVCAVLDDAVHQLAVLGGIMPDYASSAAAVEHVMGDELLQILEEQKRMDRQIRKVSSPGALRETARGITTAAETARSAKSVAENMSKLQEDRGHLERVERCRKRVSELKKQLVEVKRSKEKELSELNETIAHLKDQLQELKAKTGLEEKFIKKSTQATVEIVQHRLDNSVTGLEGSNQGLEQKLRREGS